MIEAKNATDLDNLHISIYPKQQWVICLDTITPEVLSFKQKKLTITISYTHKERKRTYKEIETINFEDYKNFLIYISETDELTQTLKKTNSALTKIEKDINKLIKNDSARVETTKYLNLDSANVNTIVSGVETLVSNETEGHSS